MDTRTARDSQRGQSIVEVALVLPVALLLLAGAIDMGRLFFARVSIENGAREGAVFAASYPRCDTSARADCSDPVTADWRVRNEATGLSGLTTSFVCFDGSNPRLSVEDCEAGDTYEVTVTDQFDFLTPVLEPILGASLTLEATAATRVLNTATDPDAEPYPWPGGDGDADGGDSGSDPVTCTVPQMVGLKLNKAEDAWADELFTGELTPNGSNNFTVVSQSLAAYAEHPCDTPVTVTG